MSMLAAGAYLQRLRKGRGMSQEDIAILLGTSQKQISLWELGKHQAASTALAAFTDAVGGNREHVMRLLADVNAGTEHGISLAEAWINRGLTTQNQKDRVDQIIETIPPDELKSLIQDLQEEIDADPGFLAFLKGIITDRRSRGVRG